MLIEFAVTNYCSISARQTLSMAAGHFNELQQNTFIPKGDEKLPPLLKAAVLYGPNASGKSTLIQALLFVQQLVLNSHKESQAGDEIEVTPFKLDAKSRAADSEFELTFIEQGVRYQYGICVNRQRITEEWLFAYPHGRPQKWFHRVFDVATNKDEYKFSATFLGGRQRQIWADETRANALFLARVVQLNNEQLKPAFDWFRSRLKILTDKADFGRGYTIEKCKSETARNQIVAFMKSADLSIADIQLKEDKFYDPVFFHADIDSGGPIAFEEVEESEGTRALFSFAGPWLDAIENNRVLVVDELDTNLHPLIAHHLVNLLQRANSQAQLIFTTHDTTLLSQKLLRRDQIWFMEKNKQSATHLYPLSDFTVRENEAIERGYLNGRYGGIPFLKALDFYGQ